MVTSEIVQILIISLAFRQVQETQEKCKYDNEISTVTWLSPRYMKQQVLKFKLEMYVSPLRGPVHTD